MGTFWWIVPHYEAHSKHTELRLGSNERYLYSEYCTIVFEDFESPFDAQTHFKVHFDLIRKLVNSSRSLYKMGDSLGSKSEGESNKDFEGASDL